MKSKFYYSLFLFIFFIPNLQAQLFIDNSYTVEEMVMDFFDNSCVTPTNITYTGTPESVAFFDAGNTNLGVQAGIFISSGNVFDAIGPNSGGGTGMAMNTPGDMDLSNLLGGVFTNDAAVIEMDIEATGDILEFSYVFGSEEYPEYVGSSFNDGFAFFISGPGITGLENIAMIPGTNQPVAINNVNAMSNSTFYVDNSNGQEIEFDGYTTEMIATVSVMANQTYHVKIVIADVNDGIFDSGIFLGVESLCGDSLLSPISSTNLIIDDQNLTVAVENNSKYATTHIWDFGDGSTSNEKNPAAHIYAAEGEYEVSLITLNYCCSDTLISTIEVGIIESVDDLENPIFQINPNPVSSFLEINFEKEGRYEVRIFDTMGKMVYTHIGEGQSRIDFSNLISGLYILEITFQDKKYLEKITRR